MNDNTKKNCNMGGIRTYSTDSIFDHCNKDKSKDNRYKKVTCRICSRKMQISLEASVLGKYVGYTE